MTSIYEDVDNIQRQIDECYNLETGEVYEEKEAELIAKLAERLEGGIEYLCKSRVNKLNALDGIKNEELRLKEKGKSIEKAIDRIDTYLLTLLEKSGQKKVNAGTFTVSSRQSTQVMLSSDFNDKEYEVIKEDKRVDKKKIAEDIKAGKEIKGAWLQTNYNLVVK